MVVITGYTAPHNLHRRLSFGWGETTREAYLVVDQVHYVIKQSSAKLSVEAQSVKAKI